MVFDPDWQLPTFSGTKSYQNLLVGVYGGIVAGNKSDSIVQQEPISLVRSGFYHYSFGDIRNRSSGGHFWEVTLYSATHARFSYFRSTDLYPQNYDYKGFGFTVRCLVPLEGWQLPTYSGTKSYQNLLVEVYGGTSGGSWSNTHLDTIVQNNPTNVIRSGYYHYSSGDISARSSGGYFWESISRARVLYLDSIRLSPQAEYSYTGYGFPLRCLVRWVNRGKLDKTAYV